MAHSQTFKVKRMRCPNLLCLGVATGVGVNEFHCKTCGSRWLIRELNVSTKTMRGAYQSRSGVTEYNPEDPNKNWIPKFRRR